MENITLEVLREFIEALKVISPVVWEAAVKATVIEGWFDIIFSIPLFVLSFGAYRIMRILQKNHEDDYLEQKWYEDTDMVMVTVLFWLLIFLVLSGGILILRNGMTNVMVPEFGAIHNILYLLQN